MHQSIGSEPARGDLAPILRRFEVWTVALLLASVVFHLVCGLWLHTGGQAAYPLSEGYHLFGDFSVFRSKFHHFGTPAFWTTGYPLTYPAPGIIACEPFFLFPKPLDMVVYESFYLFALGTPVVLFARALHRTGVASSRLAWFAVLLSVCSWPAILLLDRGNVEVFVWIVLASGMWAYATGRLWLASACFGVATSMKLFPFVLLGLFLSRRHYSKVLFALACFAASTIICLAMLGPSVPFAIHQIALGLETFKSFYMSSWLPGESGVDHSIFGLFKLLAVTLFHHRPTGFVLSLAVYLWLAAVSGVLLYVLRIRKLPLLNQVLCLVIASVYFTAFSGDGTLIHLYYPLAMMILLAQQAWRARVVVPGLHFMMACMVLLLSCETFLVHGTTRYIGPLHCLVLAALLFAALRYPLGPPKDSAGGERVLSKPDVGWLQAGSRGDVSQ